MENLLDNIIWDIPQTLLSTQRNINISNFITHDACQKYYKTFKSQWVPLSFIEFNFEEYKKYTFLSTDYLAPFFKEYQSSHLIAILENYYNTNYSIIKKKKTRDEETFYFIDPAFYIDARLSSPDVLGRFDPELYRNLDNICTHTVSGDELLSTQELYENFMMKKIVLSHTSKFAKNNIKKTTPTTIKDRLASDGGRVAPIVSTTETLVGEKTEMPEQKGKVTKLFFPKLSLPSPYPVLNNRSRIDSSKRAKKFSTPDNQTKLINRYRINQVKYSVGFIEKRKFAAKPAKKKFEFDF